MIALYETKCPHCGGHHLPNLVDSGPFDDILDAIAKKLYYEKVSKGYIDDGLYKQTANDLLKAMHDGLGGTSFKFEDPRNSLKGYLEQNIYAFSGAKSQVELEHFRSLLRDSDSYTAFRNAVLDAGYQFNNNWLHTEYNTANAATQSAAQWASYEAEGVEVLEYSTVGDDKVRPAHQALDGFTALLSNPIWNLIYPPNDWNCRCWVVPGISDNIDGVKIDPDFLKDEIPKYFQRNWGKTKVLFDSDHPYFKNSYGDIKQWGAEEIYNMPSVSNLYKKFEYEAKIEFGSKEEANKWWSDEAGGQRKFFDVEDKKGLTIRFDNKFRNHVFEDNTDERYLIIANIKDIVQQPDEIWTVRNGDTLTRHYLKYYKDFPQIVSVENDGGMRAYTFHDFNKNGKLNKKEIEKVRRGQLVYRKN